MHGWSREKGEAEDKQDWRKAKEKEVRKAVTCKEEKYTGL